ncbi:MAG: hypothetical protein Q8L02_02085 [Candidatus Nitrotoga sp.]|nr:hypothetical protein [Candidatus Nitrotoga sp.]
MNKPEKEYGKLSLDQFKWFVKELPEVRIQMQELPELVRTASKEKINEILDKKCNEGASLDITHPA